MSSYLAIRISHSLPAVLLLLGIVVHIILIWRARQNTQMLQQKLQRSRQISLPLFAILLVSLPISGWWLTHLAAMPLSQNWLLISIALLPLLFIAGWLLERCLRRWQMVLADSSTQTTSKAPLWSLIWGLVLLVLLLLISALMGAKPV